MNIFADIFMFSKINFFFLFRNLVKVYCIIVWLLSLGESENLLDNLLKYCLEDISCTNRLMRPKKSELLDSPERMVQREV